MKTLLPVLTVLAALAALAQAQSLFTIQPALRNEDAAQSDPTNQTDAAAMAVRTGVRPVQIGSWPKLAEQEIRGWKAGLEQPLPPLTRGEGGWKAGGPLADTFRLKLRTSTDRSPGRGILDRPVINLFVPQLLPRPTRQGPYLAWGESNRPWTRICDRHHDSEQGMWLTLR